jgi:hypothetical protein
MKYAALIYTSDEPLGTEEERAETYKEYVALSEEKNVFGGAELAAATTATAVRVRDGETLTTDGPFAETKEVLGGFYLLEADNLDDAIAFAARIPGARHGVIEVRPLVER